MRRMVSLFLIPIIGLGLLMMIPGCFPVIVEDEPWAPDGHWGNNHYDYYPDSNVYYDRDRNYYFFHEGGQWREAPSLPPTYHMDKDHHRELHLDTDKPYSYHPEVTKRFPPGQRKKMDRD